MKAENIKIASLKTAHDCLDAIAAIESDKQNHSCSYADWNKGYDCGLKATSIRKIQAITRKLNSLPDGE